MSPKILVVIVMVLIGAAVLFSGCHKELSENQKLTKDINWLSNAGIPEEDIISIIDSQEGVLGLYEEDDGRGAYIAYNIDGKTSLYCFVEINIPSNFCEKKMRGLRILLREKIPSLADQPL